jgi:outer membrane receptor protein involved in Fe transport
MLGIVSTPEAPVVIRDDGAADDATEIETVVVTGELVARERDRTTTSVTVVRGRDIERSTARDAYDVIRSVPNAGLYDSDVGYGSMTLRGINSYGAGAIQNIALYGTATAIVYDGVALPRSAMAYSDLSAFDINQVEVFRGPQSTSLGRNAMAGAVVINTVEPSVDTVFASELRGRLGAGSDGAWQAAAAAGVTMWPDVLALRIATDHRASDGDIRNVTRDEEDWARDSSHGLRARLAFAPFGADGAYTALFGIGDLDRYTGNRYVEQANESRGVATSDEPSFIDSGSQLYSLDQRLRLGQSWTLRAVTAVARADTHQHVDTDYSALDDGYLDQQQDADSVSQELRAGFVYGDWRGSFGAYYFDGHDGDAYNAETALSAFIGASEACATLGVCAPLLGNVLSSGASPADVEDIAVYGELDWSVTNRLTLTAGLRFDHEDNARIIDSTITGDTPVALLTIELLKASGALGEDGRYTVEREFSAGLPKFAMTYEVAQGVFLGAAYTEGYRPGGASYNYATGRHYAFDSERTRNYELSIKGRALFWRTQFALNLFHTDWDDMQVTVGEPPDTYIANAGRSRIDGGELELALAPLRNLRLYGGLGITRGRFIDFDVAGDADYSGNSLPKAPRYSTALAVEWSPIAAITIRPDLLIVGATPSQPDNDALHQIDAYALLNCSLHWQLGRFALFLNGSNLTDKHYRTDAASYSVSGIPVAALGPGRRLFGGLEFQL